MPQLLRSVAWLKRSCTAPGDAVVASVNSRMSSRVTKPRQNDHPDLRGDMTANIIGYIIMFRNYISMIFKDCNQEIIIMTESLLSSKSNYLSSFSFTKKDSCDLLELSHQIILNVDQSKKIDVTNKINLLNSLVHNSLVHHDEVEWSGITDMFRNTFEWNYVSIPDKILLSQIRIVANLHNINSDLFEIQFDSDELRCQSNDILNDINTQKKFFIQELISKIEIFVVSFRNNSNNLMNMRYINNIDYICFNLKKLVDELKV